MARNKPLSKVKEILGGSSGQPPEDHALPTPGVTTATAPAFGSASPDDMKNAPKKIVYRVMVGGYINIPPNGKTAVRAGKLVNNLDFDLALMQSQGVVLERVTPPDPPAEAPKVEEKEESPPPSDK